MTWIPILSLLLVLCYHTKSQTTESYYIYYPDEASFTHQFQMAFDTEEELFLCNIHVEDNTWAAIGFADSTTGEEVGQMAGVDSWVFGDFGSGTEVLEFALGAEDIGTEDAQQNLDYTVYEVTNGVYEVHIERDLVTGTRDDYDIVNGGRMCILWAIGYSIQVETGHSNTTRGMQCFDLPGTTDSPTPTPTYFPTPSPSQSPTIRPTEYPTTFNGTSPPSPSPTDRPTDLPTTANPTQSPTHNPTREPGSPTGDPTPSPTKPPTREQGVPTVSPTTQAPTLTPTIYDDQETEPPEEQDNGNDNSDLQELFLILFIVLGVLICILLATICYCYEHRRRERVKRNKEKEEAYEKMENYRAEHGLDIPENAPAAVVEDDDDDDDDNYGSKATIGSAQPSHKVGAQSDDSDDLEKDDELADILSGKDPPPAYAPPAIGSGAAKAEKQRRERDSKRGPKKRNYRGGKDLGVDGTNDSDDDVIGDIKATPGGPTDSNDGPEQEARKGKFVDPDKQRRDQIRKERQKRVEDRAKLTQNQTSESLRKQNAKKDTTGGDDDDYDYEAARREREERKKRREARRKRAGKKKQGKFGVFDEDNW